MQGVGFRPFVHALATGLGLTGLVGNDLDGVFAEVEGPAAAVSEFLRRLERDAPPLARIERVTATAITPRRLGGTFVIAASDAGSGLRRTLVSADTATCADCLRELPTRPTGGTSTRSSTAPTAGPGSPSSATCPTTGR